MANRVNPNALSGLTIREKGLLEIKAKQGWKCYFIERDSVLGLMNYSNGLRERVRLIRNGEVPDISHLTQMFLELYEKVRELVDCPVCLEPMEKDNTHIPICGHLICKNCKPSLDKCPICRREY